MTWGAVASIGGSLIAGYLGKKNSNSASSAATTPGYYDPYASYRGAAAGKLNDLMTNPMQYLDQTPEYGAMLTAAQRTAASQGYNGSGNALVAAAQAGGQAYQQAFNNLATLSGATQSPANGAMLAANQGNYNQQMSNQMWGNLGGLFGRLGSSLGSSLGGSNIESGGIPWY